MIEVVKRDFMVNGVSCSDRNDGSPVSLLVIVALRRKIRILYVSRKKKHQPNLDCSHENGGEPEKSTPTYRLRYVSSSNRSKHGSE